MPEVYTCLCGHQYWAIYGMGSEASDTGNFLHIECKDCKTEYSVPHGMGASDFNEKREELKD